MQQGSVGGRRVSPVVYLLLRRLLRHQQPGQFDRAELRELLDAAMASTGRYDDDDEDDDGKAARIGLEAKRADARRCFYHAVNCW